MMLSQSKVGMYESRIDFSRFENIGVNHIYRALAVIAGRKEDIEEYLITKRYNLLNNQIDLVFCDVTTIYLISSSTAVQNNLNS